MLQSQEKSSRRGVFHKISTAPLVEISKASYKELFSQKKSMGEKTINLKEFSTNMTPRSGSIIDTRNGSIMARNGSITARNSISYNEKSKEQILTARIMEKYDSKNQLQSEAMVQNPIQVQTSVENLEFKNNDQNDNETFFLTSVSRNEITRTNSINSSLDSGLFPAEFIAEISQAEKLILKEDLSLELQDEEFLPIDIMSVLDHERMEHFKSDFLAFNKPLTVSQFVATIRPYLPKCDPLNSNAELNLVASLIRLFSEVDVNGDGTLEWQELTNFIIDAGTNLRDISRVDRIPEYRRSLVADQSRHDHAIEKVTYVEFLDILVVFNKNETNIKIFSAKTLQLLHRVPGHKKVPYACAFIPPRHLLTSSSDNSILFYDVLEGYKNCGRMQLDSNAVSLMYHSEKNKLYVSTDTNDIFVYTIEHSTLPSLLDIKFNTNFSPEKVGNMKKQLDSTMDIIVLPNLNWIATASLDKTIVLWDYNFKVKHTLTGHTRGVYSLAYNAEYHCLISAGFDHDAYIWNPYYASCIGKLKGHFNCLVGVVTIPNTPQIFTSDISGMVKIWDIRNFSCTQSIIVEDDFDFKISISSFQSCPSHKRVVIAGNRLYAYDSQSLLGIDPTLADQQTTVACLYSEISGCFLTAAGKTVKIWNGKNGTLQSVYRNLLENSEITSITFDASYKKFIVGDSLGKITVFNVLSGSEMVSLSPSHSGDVSNLAYISNISAVISTSWDKKIRIYDESNHERPNHLIKENLKNDDDITCMSHSNNLTLVATGSSSGKIHIWDYELDKIESDCIGHLCEINCLLFLEPYPMLISTDLDGNICLWLVRPIVTAPCCILRLVNYFGNEFNVVTALNWHSESNRLITGDDSGTVKVYDFSKIISKWRIQKLNESYIKSRMDNLIKERKGLPSSIAHTAARTLVFDEYRLNHEKKVSLQETCNWYRNQVSKADINISAQWNAHEQTIRHLLVVRDPLTIVTTSFDNKVSLWDFAGNSKGGLYQGHSSLCTIEQLQKDFPKSIFSQFKFRTNLQNQHRSMISLANTIIEKNKYKRELYPLSPTNYSYSP